MPFKLTAARVHPLHGLEVTDDSGRSFLCGEKITVAEEGAVIFREIEAEDCPYSVRWGYPPSDRPGTDDPFVIALTLKWLRGEIPFRNDWQSVPLAV
jgi:hypothetical protein